MPIPQALVTRYFQLVVGRQFAEGERELNKIKQRMTKTEWNRGYFRALYGMLLSRKTASDSYSFFSKLDLTDKLAINNYRREFLDHTRNGLHGDFDRGYFSAWADCMRTVARLDLPTSQSQKAEAAADQVASQQLETLKTDKSQATIANFLKKLRDAEETGEETKESN